MRSITGWIGKTNPQAYAIKTPVATIGVRGTDHETMVILAPESGQPQSAGVPGTYDKVNQGSTVVRTDKGSVVVTPNQAAFAELEGKAAPRLLASIPDFYKPTLHEKRIEERRDTLEKEMLTHRSVRQKEIEESAKKRHVPAPRHRVVR